jgi:hypothetical protein
MARKNMKSRAPAGKAKRGAMKVTGQRRGPAAAKKAARGGRKQTKAEAERVLRDGPIRKRKTLPKDQPLPGMEGARIKPLDDIAHAIKETRAEIADLQAEEKGLEQTALNLMRQHRKVTWTFGGVRLTRNPGEEKLSVKVSRANATAETPEEDILDDVEAMDSQRSEDTGNAAPALEREGLAGDAAEV